MSSGAPVAFGPAVRARALSAGGSHTCALLDEGTLSCWGASTLGQLGYSDPATIGDNEPVSSAGRVPVGATMIGSVADLSLSASADATGAEVGQEVAITVLAANAGADPATGVTVAAALPSGLAHAGWSAAQGAYDPATGAWQVGTLAPGAPATLSLRARVAAEGPHDVVVEVAASGVVDPDSAPGNAAAGEDDRAAVRVTGLVASAAPAPQAPGGPPAAPGPPVAPGPGPAARRRPRSLSLTVRPRRDLRPPVRLRVAGRLALPAGVRAARACAGRVVVSVRRGRAVVARGRPALRRVAGRCAYAWRRTFAARGWRARGPRALRVHARFIGTPALLPRAARAARVRVR
ncbi:DUF11 domain-containing protein [Miltoncostaea marina]|uniref:DUF11 domain-containing protein n=1 Tax=Miltoncostaea marina TaxID=2843215 RepID=UPI001FE4C385|nr:hypothetical protein [Miltoncostaea marina]